MTWGEREGTCPERQLAKMMLYLKQSQYDVPHTTRPHRHFTLFGACVLLKLDWTLQMDSSGKVNG